MCTVCKIFIEVENLLHRSMARLEDSSALQLDFFSLDTKNRCAWLVLELTYFRLFWFGETERSI
jgi:hypothetical protein